MSLECVQFLNTVISRESILIKLFEASNEDRDVINKVLDLLKMVPKKGAASPSSGVGWRPQHDRLRSLKKMSRSMLVNSPSDPEEVAKTKITEMQELVCTMKELIGILKSG